MSSTNVEEYLNKIFLGEVASVHNYGAFVRIPGGNLQGLVHRSQVSSVNVDDAADVLSKGDRVWCKVVKITDDGKLSLSMKVVNQGNGTDLDPNGVQIYQDELKRKSQPEGSRRKAITLEAVLNTNCSKCGTRGHLARDCFQSPDGKVYELIPEDDDPVLPQVPAPPSESAIKLEHKSKHKKKKSKKEKKAKKRKRSSSSSSSEDLDRSKKKKKGKKSRIKKEK